MMMMMMMVFDGEPSMLSPENSFCGLQLCTRDLENLTNSQPERGSVCVSFGSNPVSGPGAIAFTRFSWPSLTDIDL